ncbi:MAG: N-6 DNA methylase [Planctomycetaceae bacterium]
MLDDRSHRRTFGVFYTPAHLADLMAELSIPRCERDRVAILDPACGDGALLAAALKNQMGATSESNRLDLIRDRLFGVDVDPLAVAQTRRRLFDSISPRACDADELRQRLDAQIVCGNALTGADFSDAKRIAPRDDEPSPDIDWKNAFPQIARRGGFDLVIANPPYRRERNSKPMFDRLAESPLGKRWRTPRMDLWHYFFHRGLDLLQPDGRLCFLVNSYWTKSPGARPLIERMHHETAIEEIVEFDTLPLFEEVGGRHLILQLQKSAAAKKRCRLTRMKSLDDQLTAQHSTWLAPSEMFHGGQLILQSQIPLEHAMSDRLGERFLVRQGIAENPPTINAKLTREFPDLYRIGDGVFVLTADEVASLEMNDDERPLLRPYAQPLELQRYHLPTEPKRFLLYLTPRTAPDLSRFPHIERHLQRFRPLLERRREVQKGSISWWHLHWPREERLFTQPRILHVQMGRRPTFVYAEEPLFVGFSVNIVAENFTRENDRQLRLPDHGDLPLPVLTAILNSASAADWFAAFAKRRGVNLEISGTVLRRFPLPQCEPETTTRLNELSVRYHAELSGRSADEEHADIERDINALVADLYGAR